MSMNFELSLTQEQKLIMTQEMQLSVKLLQMSSLELQEYVQKEVQENPVLEFSEETSESIHNEKSLIEYKELVKYLNFDNYSHQHYDKDDEELSPFSFVHEKKTLVQFLADQINDSDVKGTLKAICIYIINNLDEKGYLDCPLENITDKLKVSFEVVKEALGIVQGLEPPGIAARDLKECLKLQLERVELQDKNFLLIIDQHLEDIADNKYSSISKALDIDIRAAQQYGDQIKKLNPKPSSGFYTGEEAKYVIPDAYIRLIDGDYQVIMNDEVVPHLRINEIYKEILRNEFDKEALAYVKQKLDSAVFLMKSVEHRKSTINRVLNKILELQEDYFEAGENSIKPMTLKDISESLNIHESTVSRAIKDKYINTNKGTIRIKDLFTTGIASKESFEDVSTAIIKNKIKTMIDMEEKTSPLSDQGICDNLNELGMNISRRTVAKYREEMNIKSSSKRKRF